MYQYAGQSKPRSSRWKFCSSPRRISKSPGYQSHLFCDFSFVILRDLHQNYFVVNCSFISSSTLITDFLFVLYTTRTLTSALINSKILPLTKTASVLLPRETKERKSKPYGAMKVPKLAPTSKIEVLKFSACLGAWMLTWLNK